MKSIEEIYAQKATAWLEKNGFEITEEGIVRKEPEKVPSRARKVSNDYKVI